MPTLDVQVPDIGDFTDVPVAEILVAVGDEVAADDPLVVLESDKASMEIPAPQAGTVRELQVSVGDVVSEGAPLLVLEVAELPAGTYAPEPAGPAASSDGAAGDAVATEPPARLTGDSAPQPPVERGDVHAPLLVLGSGPGGYAAAFRAADLGLEVVLVERHATLGGVCLNVGCIPSKALLHVAKVLTEARDLASNGIRLGEPELDLDGLRTWKDGVVAKLTRGVGGMAKGRKVTVVQGEARFTGPNALAVATDEGTKSISFDQAIVAAGSRSVKLPGIPHDDPRVMDSTDALALADVPGRLLVVGGGIIGLEMATVYDALGSDVTVVELTEGLIPEADPDLVKPLHRRIAKQYAGIHLGTRVEGVEAREDGLLARFSGDVEDAVFDRVLVAVGRTPNGAGLGLDAAGVHVDDRGFVSVDEQQRTNVSHIFAIGDVAQPPMLAHKATAEGHVAAEVAAGHAAAFDARAIPSVAYTDPEVAWVGLTEREAEAQGVAYEKSVFPWSASGRALAIDAGDGFTKLLHDPETRRVLGGGAVGANAGELLAEIGLAIEMGADVGDLALTVHAHPTLSETVGLAAEVADGTITDLPNPRARAARSTS